jgi:hypothetical protein
MARCTTLTRGSSNAAGGDMMQRSAAAVECLAQQLLEYACRTGSGGALQCLGNFFSELGRLQTDQCLQCCWLRSALLE